MAQAVRAPTPIGQQDTLDPGDEPPPPTAYGDPLPAPTPPAAFVSAQRAYLTELLVEEHAWTTAGLAESEKNVRRSQLKDSMMGGWQ